MSRWTRGPAVLWRPFRALFSKSPWWLRILLVVVPILLVLALLDPVVGLLGVVMQFVTGVLQPLLLTPAGRLVLFNIGLGVAVMFGFVPLRRRWRELRAEALLADHLRGVEELVTETGQPETRFQRVIQRLRRRGGPDSYPELAVDARLKLARVALHRRDPDAAVGQLARVREADLPPELLRSLAQLRTDAYLAQDALLPESVDAELDRLLERFPDDPALLARKRGVTLSRGDLIGAIPWQERVVQTAAPIDAPSELARLAEDLLAAGRVALSAGDLEMARGFALRAREAGTQHPEIPALLGDASLAEGDARAALREWGLQPTPTSLRRIRQFIDRPVAGARSESEPRPLPARDILELSPNEGTLLALAERFARAGQGRRAERVLERAERELPWTETVAATAARVAQTLGDSARSDASWTRLFDAYAKGAGADVERSLQPALRTPSGLDPEAGAHGN